jgi:esterase/lipase superfamily enzyme
MEHGGTSVRVVSGIGVLCIVCGCRTTGERNVDITTPRAEFTRSGGESHTRLLTLQTESESDAAESHQRQTVVRVFYGRERARQTNDGSLVATASMMPLEYGVCHVSIPLGRDDAGIEHPLSWRFEFDERPEGASTLLGIDPVARDEFIRELQLDVSASTGGEALVFVHGENVAFEHSARQAAQIVHNLQFDGPPVLYSWPAGAPQSQLVQFLQTVSRDSGVQKLDVIALGRGSQLVLDALSELSDMPFFDGRPHISQVILASPDIDGETLPQDVAQRIENVADRVTVYASENAGVAIPDVPGMDVVGAEPDSFEAFNPVHPDAGSELLSDIRQVLAGAPTTQRGLQPQPARQPAWRLPAPEVQLASHDEPESDPVSDEVAEDDQKTKVTQTAAASLWGRAREWFPW